MKNFTGISFCLIFADSLMIFLASFELFSIVAVFGCSFKL